MIAFVFIFLVAYILFWVAMSFYGEWKVAQGELEREREKYQNDMWELRNKRRD